jgi:hypothetical protein
MPSTVKKEKLKFRKALLKQFWSKKTYILSKNKKE